MRVHENELIENGNRIILTRRQVWDLEQKGARKNSFEIEELKIARRNLRFLLRERKNLVAQAQGKMFR